MNEDGLLRLLTMLREVAWMVPLLQILEGMYNRLKLSQNPLLEV